MSASDIETVMGLKKFYISRFLEDYYDKTKICTSPRENQKERWRHQSVLASLSHLHPKREIDIKVADLQLEGEIFLMWNFCSKYICGNMQICEIMPFCCELLQNFNIFTPNIRTCKVSVQCVAGCEIF